MATEDAEIVNAQIAEYSRESHDEYLAEYEDVHERVAEDASMLVFADSDGHELTEWANEIGVSREAVSNWMHSQAENVDYSWVASDPVVLLRD